MNYDSKKKTTEDSKKKMLKVNTNTLRELTSAELKQIVGGDGGPSTRCP
jgi:hypothetical protein